MAKTQTTHTHSNATLHNDNTSRTLISASAPNHTATSVSPTSISPQTALHNKGRLTPVTPRGPKLTTTNHRRHRFRPHQRYPKQVTHPHTHTFHTQHPYQPQSEPPVASAAPLPPAAPSKQATPSQAHSPQATLLPASVTPALPPESGEQVTPSDGQFFRKQRSYCCTLTRISRQLLNF